MELKDFIGKVVIASNTNTRYILKKIHSAYITVETGKLNAYGTRSSYMFKTDNEDPFTSGVLRFEDESLTELFKQDYKEYCHSKYGCSEAYLYWILTD